MEDEQLYANKIVKVEGEFITIFDGLGERYNTITNSKLRFYSFNVYK